VSLARISITIPPDLVAEADRRAGQLGRSRSWVVAEALRRYLAERRNGVVRGGEEVAPYVARQSGLGESRRMQLEADLALTPEERVREAEATARVGELQQETARQERILLFNRYEDYLDWKRREDVGA
jgi:hypothetical protein